MVVSLSTTKKRTGSLKPWLSDVMQTMQGSIHNMVTTTTAVVAVTDDEDSDELQLVKESEHQEQHSLHLRQGGMYANIFDDDDDDDDVTAPSFHSEDVDGIVDDDDNDEYIAPVSTDTIVTSNITQFELPSIKEKESSEPNKSTDDAYASPRQQTDDKKKRRRKKSTSSSSSPSTTRKTTRQRVNNETSTSMESTSSTIITEAETVTMIVEVVEFLTTDSKHKRQEYFNEFLS